METFIGTILPFAFNYPPVDWMACQGQVMQVAQYQALYSLLGNIYGGTPPSTFNLPDLQGRIPIGAGQGRGLTARVQGQQAGGESAALSIGNLPPHNHPASATSTTTGGIQISTNTAGNTTAPSATNNILSASGGGQGSATIWGSTMTGPVNLGGVNLAAGVNVTVGNTGAGAPINLMNPFLVLNFCIAIQGLWPPRN
jgi:microcystin-dependent protein